MEIRGLRGSGTRPPRIPWIRESRGLRYRGTGNPGSQGSGIPTIRVAVFSLSLMRLVVSAICPSPLSLVLLLVEAMSFPDLPAPAFSGTLRSENQRVVGTLELLVRGISHFRVFFCRPDTSPLPPLPCLCLAARCGSVVFTTAARALSPETCARPIAICPLSHHDPLTCCLAIPPPGPCLKSRSSLLVPVSWLCFTTHPHSVS